MSRTVDRFDIAPKNRYETFITLERLDNGDDVAICIDGNREMPTRVLDAHEIRRLIWWLDRR